MKTHIERLFKLVYTNLKMNEPLDHYLSRIENTESPQISIFKSGLSLIGSQDGYDVQPTTYEVILDIQESSLIYKIGNLKVYKEQYAPAALIKLFSKESVILLTQPDPADIDRFLKAVRLLNPEIEISKQEDLSHIFYRIQEGEIPVGRYYEKTTEGYHFIEVSEEFNEAVVKKINCQNLDSIIYALNGVVTL